MSEDGLRLAQCVTATTEYCYEIEALANTLMDLTIQEITRNKRILPCTICGNYKIDSRSDNSGWVCTDKSYSLPLVGKKKHSKDPDIYLSYQISLIGNGAFFPGNQEPLLHALLWGDALSFDKDYYMGYPLDSNDYPYELESNRLITWAGKETGWKSRGWAFSIRLLSLDSSQALLDRVVKPAISLLKIESTMAVLPDDLPGLIIYPDPSVLTNNNEEE